MFKFSTYNWYLILPQANLGKMCKKKACRFTLVAYLLCIDIVARVLILMQKKKREKLGDNQVFHALFLLKFIFLFKLGIIKGAVEAAFSHQFFMVSHFRYFSV